MHAGHHKPSASMSTLLPRGRTGMRRQACFDCILHPGRPWGSRLLISVCAQLSLPLSEQPRAAQPKITLGRGHVPVCLSVSPSKQAVPMHMPPP